MQSSAYIFLEVYSVSNVCVCVCVCARVCVCVFMHGHVCASMDLCLSMLIKPTDIAVSLLC